MKERTPWSVFTRMSRGTIEVEFPIPSGLRRRLPQFLYFSQPPSSRWCHPKDAGAKPAFDCEITARNPVLENGEVVGKADVECDAQEGREITTAVRQKDSNGLWVTIEDSVTSWEGSDRQLPLYHPDSTGIDCQELSDHNTREFKFLITVSNAAGDTIIDLSDDVRLSRDCLAESGIDDHADGVHAAASGGGVSGGIIPEEPFKRGSEVWAKTFFDCSSAGPGDVRYFRVRLVKVQTGLDRVVRNRAFTDTSGLARGFNLIAACRFRSVQNETYYNSSREVYEERDGTQFSGTAVSDRARLKVRCR
ncbi:MAG: hypothetical protein ACRDJC_03895 [Thermomicrobiales bacterium]